ncbi:MAG: YqiA/YcfP family alpha/beta fold hydrolase [Pseudanabaenaceae cyanobacterium]
MTIIYLHGFGSSPQSGKAQFLKQKCQEISRELLIPDLTLGNFQTMTITKILNYLQHSFSNEALLVVGSSLGGFIAVQWAIRNVQIKEMILLAPALNFPAAIGQWIGSEALAEWEKQGTREFFHYGFQKNIALNYEFYLDAQQYRHWQLARTLSIAILHGKQDEVVPAEVSIEFQKQYPQVELHLVESDHSLNDPVSLELLWQKLKSAIERLDDV